MMVLEIVPKLKYIFNTVELYENDIGSRDIKVWWLWIAIHCQGIK